MKKEEEEEESGSEGGRTGEEEEVSGKEVRGESSHTSESARASESAIFQTRLCFSETDNETSAPGF